MKVTVDCREPRERYQMLHAYLPDVEWRKLPQADYIIWGPIPWFIERKTITDFLSSLGDGRLFRQAGALARLAEKESGVAILLLEGSWRPERSDENFLVRTPHRRSGYRVNSFLGALVRVQQLGLKVITSAGPDETDNILLSLAGFRLANPRDDGQPAPSRHKNPGGSVQAVRRSRSSAPKGRPAVVGVQEDVYLGSGRSDDDAPVQDRPPRRKRNPVV